MLEGSGLSADVEDEGIHYVEIWGEAPSIPGTAKTRVLRQKCVWSVYGT